MKNKWKVAFWGLLSFIMFLILFILFQLFQPVDEQPVELSPSLVPEVEAEFTVETTREDLTIVVNRFIEEELNDSINYSVLFEDQVSLNGSIPVFSTEIDFQMTFDSQALENGDLLLTQQSLFLGAMEMPVANILKFIEKSYEFPEWVEIQPNEQQIIVQVSEINVASGLSVKTNHFNLRENDISFSVYVPQ
ncbi:YpmS family protein [Jeotgalibacillus marinus]|uniref:YpmS family protein n=1 Tax=Jeotgalibacillus marinus TaxID=86667 RepID=A0ABV3Q3B3_9BACL